MNLLVLGLVLIVAGFLINLFGVSLRPKRPGLDKDGGLIGQAIDAIKKAVTYMREALKPQTPVWKKVCAFGSAICFLGIALFVAGIVVAIAQATPPAPKGSPSPSAGPVSS